METGKKYKLTDKCITPGGRNMTRDEDAIIEAKKYYRNDIKCYDAFLHGVEWAEEQIANVWHDASEEPKGTYIVLCDGLDNRQWVVDYLHIDMSYANWQDYADAISVIRWAYISDLLPKGGEK